MWIKKKGVYKLRIRKFLFARQTMLPVETSVYSRRPAIPMNESLLAAQEWMSSCLDKHEQCQKHTQPHIYPTRLLKLESHNIRLVHPQDDQISGPYAALSYCWGPNPNFIRLTADNLQEFRVEIPYTTLPIAFQEAIHVIKELGIRYLWIDALCIIQSGFGSSEDWQFESGRMQEVYSNCIINLSLAQAAHPDQSCLGGYTLDSTLPFEIDVVDKAHHHGSTETHKYTVLSRDYFTDALSNQPIGSRAWVMQERLLATRVLSIGHGELFWDCQQVPHASESLPSGFSLCSDLYKDDVSAHVDLPIPSLPQSSNSNGLEETWYKILTEYTARELKYPEADKLVALAAIATRMGYVMNDAYLGGHFHRTLPQSLNWMALREVIPELRAEQRAPKRLPRGSGQMVGGTWIVTPSWSWASMDGRLNMQGTHGRHMTFVAVMGAYDFSPVVQTEPEERVENRLLLTIRAWCRVIEWRTVEPEIDYGLRILLWDMDFVMDDMQNLPDDGTQCLLAALGTNDSGEHTFKIEGLLLREIDFDGNRVYERMGHFVCKQRRSIRLVEGGWKTLFAHGECSIVLC
jgi:hypothetical protein